MHYLTPLLSSFFFFCIGSFLLVLSIYRFPNLACSFAVVVTRRRILSRKIDTNRSPRNALSLLHHWLSLSEEETLGPPSIDVYNRIYPCYKPPRIRVIKSQRRENSEPIYETDCRVATDRRVPSTCSEKRFKEY